MNMKRYLAAAAAAAMLLCFVGCDSMQTVDIDSENQAYSRVLYDDEYVPEYDEEYYDDAEFIYEYDGEPEQQPEEKTEHKEESKHEQKNEQKSEAPSSTQKASSKSSSDENSSNTSSGGKVKISTYSVSGRRSSTASKTSSSASSKAASSSSKASDSDKKSGSDSDISSDEPYTDTESVKTAVKKGSFSADDLSYDTRRDYLDLGDSEEFVRKLLGSPNNDEEGFEDTEQPDSENTDTEEVSQPPKELSQIKGLIYDDCIVTMELDDETQTYFVVNILVPFDSYYETNKGIFTDSTVSRVIEVYGDPTRITLSDGTVITPGDTDTAVDSDAESAPEESYPDGLYSYIIGDRSFSLTIENGTVSQMIFRYEEE